MLWVIVVLVLLALLFGGIFVTKVLFWALIIALALALLGFFSRGRW